MPIIVFEEMPGSSKISLEPPTATLKYVCQGEFSRLVVAAHALANTLPLFNHPLGLLHRQRQGFEVVETDWCRYEVTVPYARNKVEAGSYKIHASTIGGTVNVKAGEFIKIYPGTAARNGGLIGVKDNGKTVEGVDIPIEETKIEYSFKHPAAFFTASQIRLFSRASGTVNLNPWGGFAGGEVKFLGFEGDEGKDIETEVKYNFAISENLTGFTLAGIPNVSKKGWEVASVYWADDVIAGKPGVKADYIEIVRPGGKPWVDFASIFGFDPA